MQDLPKGFMLQISDFSVSITKNLNITSNFEYYLGLLSSNRDVLIKLFSLDLKESYKTEKEFLLNFKKLLPLQEALLFKSYSNFSIIVFAYQEHLFMSQNNYSKVKDENLLLNITTNLMSFHKLGIVHCSLSLESLFLTSNSQIILGDVSNIIEESDPLIREVKFFLVDKLIPPEFTEFNLNPCSDSRIDTWLSGILLFQLMYPHNSSLFFKTNSKGQVNMQNFQVSREFQVILKKILNWHPLSRATSFEVFVFLMEFFPNAGKDKKDLLKTWKVGHLLGGDLNHWIGQLFLNDEHFVMQVYLNKVCFYIEKNKSKFLNVLKLFDKHLESNDFRSSVKYLLIILQIYMKYPEEMLNYSLPEDFFLFWHSNQCRVQHQNNMTLVQSIFHVIDRIREEITASARNSASNNHGEILKSLRRRTDALLEILLSDLKSFKVLKSSLIVTALELLSVVIKQLEDFNQIKEIIEFSEKCMKYLQIYQFHCSIKYLVSTSKPTCIFDSNPFPDNKYLLPSDITGATDKSEQVGDSILGVFDSNIVFIKVFDLNSFYENKEFIKMLEVQSRFSHPNLVKFHGLFINDDINLVYEHLEGGSLNKLLHIRKVSLSTRQKLQIMVGVAKAVKELHSRNFIFIGLSSYSVLLDHFPAKKSDDVTAKLLGLHHSCQFYEVDNENVQNYLPWLPPEFFSRQKIEFGSDSYAFGVLLWEVFTGNKPFQDVDLMNLYDIGRKSFPLNPFEIEVDVARYLVERCLQDEVSERPLFEDILEALENSILTFT